MTAPVVAVVPFGAFGGDAQRTGAWARSLARRLVDRFAGEREIELRPVFLVAMPERATDASYLVMGSAPDVDKAAEYARSLGATYALVGTYREDRSGRQLHVLLVDADGALAGELERAVPPGALGLLEPEVAQWLAQATKVSIARDLTTPAVANETAYAALLEAMDAEVDATVLRESDAQASWAALTRAVNGYATAARADTSSPLIEERVLVLAATAMENDLQRLVEPALDALAETRPRSWRVHYMLGEVRRTSGDANGAIVAFEHSDALQQLRPRDVLTLAQLYITSGAPAVAASRLRRVIKSDAEPAVKAAARRLRLGLKDPSLERDLEAAGKTAVDGDRAHAAEAEQRFRRVLAADPEIWEAHFGRGLLAWNRGDAAGAEEAFGRAIELNPDAAGLIAEMGEPPTN